MLEQASAEVTRSVLIVDDELPARRRLKAMVDGLVGYRVVAEAADGVEALDVNRQLSPDIVLMDIRMPGMDGLMAARHLAEQASPPAVIFCTAYDEHALAAFDAQAVDYLLKPVAKERLTASLAKAQCVNRSQMVGLMPSASEHPSGQRQGETEAPSRRCVSARTHNGYQLLPVEDIRAFIADKKYVSAHHHQGELLLDQSLKDLETEFAALFIRVHRNALVARAYILGLEKAEVGKESSGPTGDQLVIRLAGTDISPVVSRRHLPEIRRLIKHL